MDGWLGMGTATVNVLQSWWRPESAHPPLPPTCHMLLAHVGHLRKFKCFTHLGRGVEEYKPCFYFFIYVTYSYYYYVFTYPHVGNCLQINSLVVAPCHSKYGVTRISKILLLRYGFTHQAKEKTFVRVMNPIKQGGLAAIKEKCASSSQKH
ncbi:hypothetical protein BS78_01G275800 [Paspalum vaginatum]|nr:hypothetical protein BS78_01G275800 [Paspalum vaginatum]